jgi:outer membrane protein TolC
VSHRTPVVRGLRLWNTLRWGAPLALALVVPLAGGRADDAAEALAPPAPTVAAPTSLTLSLPESVQLALEKQPALAVQRASLAAAEDNARALDNLQVPACLAPDLPIRRRQAHLGVDAAAAGVHRLEAQTIYAVTRTYVTVVYAREQREVARQVVERLTTLSGTAKTQLKFGAKNVSQDDVNRLTVYSELAETRRLEADAGARRALVALREAIGFGPECSLDVPDSRLREPDARPCREELIAGALSRRADLIQAGIFAQVTALEVDAQATSRRLRKETFASVTDIHARQVPQGTQNQEYRPGAEPPEMPTNLVGSKDERMARASAFHARAEAAVAKTRNLIVLEAEDAFHRWEEVSAKVRHARRAAAAGEQLATNLGRAFTTGGNVQPADVTNAQVLGSQAQSQYNQFLYEEILALADLERVTEGAFCAGLGGSVIPPSEKKAPAPGTEKEPKKTPAMEKDLFDK